jgi:hypothetical protein
MIVEKADRITDFSKEVEGSPGRLGTGRDVKTLDRKAREEKPQRSRRSYRT